MRSAAAESPWETVRIKGEQSREVGSRESHKDGADERRDGVASARAGGRGGGVERRFLRTRSNKVAEGNGKRLGWVAEEDFSDEAADCDVSTVDGVEEGGVGRGAKGEGNIGDESSVFKIGDGRDGVVDREGRDKWGMGVYVGRVEASVRTGYQEVERGEWLVCEVTTHSHWLV